MKIRMLTSLSGPHIALAPGDTHECDDDEAARLIEAGFAEALPDEQPAPAPKPRASRAGKGS